MHGGRTGGTAGNEKGGAQTREVARNKRGGAQRGKQRANERGRRDKISGYVRRRADRPLAADRPPLGVTSSSRVTLTKT